MTKLSPLAPRETAIRADVHVIAAAALANSALPRKCGTVDAAWPGGPLLTPSRPATSPQHPWQPLSPARTPRAQHEDMNCSSQEFPAVCRTFGARKCSSVDTQTSRNCAEGLPRRFPTVLAHPSSCLPGCTCGEADCRWAPEASAFGPARLRFERCALAQSQGLLPMVRLRIDDIPALLVGDHALASTGARPSPGKPCSSSLSPALGIELQRSATQAQRQGRVAGVRNPKANTHATLRFAASRGFTRELESRCHCRPACRPSLATTVCCSRSLLRRSLASRAASGARGTGEGPIRRVRARRTGKGGGKGLATTSLTCQQSDPP